MWTGLEAVLIFSSNLLAFSCLIWWISLNSFFYFFWGSFFYLTRFSLADKRAFLSAKNFLALNLGFYPSCRRFPEDKYVLSVSFWCEAGCCSSLLTFLDLKMCILSLCFPLEWECRSWWLMIGATSWEDSLGLGLRYRQSGCLLTFYCCLPLNLCKVILTLYKHKCC